MIEHEHSRAARIVKGKSGVSDKRHVLHVVRKSVGPALGRESFGMHERVSDSFGRHERVWNNAAEKFPFAEDANSTRCFASHQRGCRDKIQCRRITDTGIVLTPRNYSLSVRQVFLRSPGERRFRDR